MPRIQISDVSVALIAVATGLRLSTVESLVSADHETVLMEQGNVDSVNHAEAVLAREAARRFSPSELWPCTLVTTVEPCAMCAGTQYWANIGRTVFGIAEKALLHLEAPIARVAGFDTPFPYTLENEYLPSVERISRAIRDTAAF